MPKYKTILAPDGGLVSSKLDPTLISSKHFTAMKNIMTHGDYFGKRIGRSAYGGLADKIMGFYHFVAGTNNRFCAMSKTAFAYRTSSGWTDKTGSAFTGANDNFFDACAAYEDSTGTWYMILTNGKDYMRSFDGTNNTANLSAWETATHVVKFVRYYNGYLVAAYITTGGTAYPFRIVVSNTDEPNDLTGNSRTFNLTRDRNLSDIMALEHFGNYLTCYKEDCIYYMYPTSTIDVFEIDVAVTDIGLRASRGIAITPYGHFFMGHDNIYLWGNVGTRPQAIGTETVKKRLFDNAAAGTLYQAIAVYHNQYNQVRFYTPDDFVLIYDIDRKSWWEEEHASISAVEPYRRDSAKLWSEMTTTWATETLRWNEVSYTDNFPLLIEGKNDGSVRYANDLVYNDVNITIDAYIDTGDRTYEFEGASNNIPFNFKRCLGICFEAKGSQSSGDVIDVYYSIDEGTTWTQITSGIKRADESVWTSPLGLSDEWAWYEGHFDVSTKKIRFRFRNNKNDSTFMVRKWYEEWEDDEQ